MKIEDKRFEKIEECEICGKEYIDDIRKNKGTKTCSFECSQKVKSNKCLRCGDPAKVEYCSEIKTRACDICGEEYEYKCVKNIKRTCSEGCTRKLRKTNPIEYKECSVCSKEYKWDPLYPPVADACSLKCGKILKPFECANCGGPSYYKYCQEMKTYECANPNCNKTLTKKCRSGMPKYCSISCASGNPDTVEQTKHTQIERYGAMGFNTEKQKETMIERYGVAVPCKNPEIQAKAEATQKARNGGVFAFETEKQRKAMVERYGAEYMMRLDNWEEIRKEGMMNKHGVSHPSKDPKILERIIQTQIDRHGGIFGGNGTISKLNRTWAEFFEEQGIEVEYEKFVDNAFFDLYLPKYDILIDLNPTISHNSMRAFACIRQQCEDGCEKHEPTKPTYHLERARIAKRNDKTLIQIYDWEDEDKVKDFIMRKVKGDKIRISARSLEVTKISQKDANVFLKENHLQGAAKKQLHCYGLFKDDELVSVATFSKARFKAKCEWEFMRFAVKGNYIIYGGAQRLFNAFVRDVNPESIVSYIDFNHTTKPQTFMDALGFTEVDGTGERLVYHNMRTNKMVPVTTLLAIGADRVLGTNYGSREESGMNNDDIMIAEGFTKVYTAGNRVYVWERE